MRVEYQIGTQNPGNGPAGTDHRNVRIRIEQDMGESGSQPRYQVEENEPDGPQEILDIVAENPEIEHVEEQMKNASVHEHRYNQRQRRRKPAEGLVRIREHQGQRFEVSDLVRNGTHLVDIELQSLWRNQLEDKDSNIQGND